mmetsp:Transcript_45386/g.116148  ORF Transcript_45386/g.116148 Transcript_45386/m.116148 type:complete len:320 (-) Transcript_45386:774-1733(-)
MTNSPEALGLEDLQLQLTNWQDDESNAIVVVDEKQLKPTDRVLGEGSYGVVRLCHWTPKQGRRRLVAMKQVNIRQPASADDARQQSQDRDTRVQFIASLVHEMQIMSALNHQHVVKFLGAGLLDSGEDKSVESAFMIQEYMCGGSMANALLRQFLSPSQIEYTTTDAFSWCLGAAKALEYLHSLSPMVIHRDVKCDNILLDGEHETSKLADFGLSALVNAKDSELAEMKSADPPGCGNCFNLTVEIGPEDLAAAAHEAMDNSTLNRRGYSSVGDGLQVDELGRVANTIYDIPDHKLFNLTGCKGTLLTMAPEVRWMRSP